jgi:uncharacterized protein with HEPN domain
MRSDAHLLEDILDATRSLDEFCDSITKEEFISSDLIRSASITKLVTLGEAANNLSEKIKNAHPEIAWVDIISNRNFIVHAYFNVDWNVVWNTIINHALPLQEQIFRILEEEYPDW